MCGLKRIVGSCDFLSRFVGMVSNYGEVSCNIDVLWRTACLVVGLVTVGGFAFLFNCTPVGRTSAL